MNLPSNHPPPRSSAGWRGYGSGCHCYQVGLHRAGHQTLPVQVSYKGREGNSSWVVIAWSWEAEGHMYWNQQVWQNPPKESTSQANDATQNSAPGQVLPHIQLRRQPIVMVYMSLRWVRTSVRVCASSEAGNLIAQSLRWVRTSVRV